MRNINLLECIPIRCAPSAAVAVLGAGARPGVGVSAGGCLPRGCLLRHPPPLVNRITDRCKNITFPQLLLRTVTRNYTYIFVPEKFALQQVSCGKAQNIPPEPSG